MPSVTDCLAIADGATESSFARLWALALAEGFVSDPSAVPALHDRTAARRWTQPLQTDVDAGRVRGVPCPGSPRTRPAPARSPRCSAFQIQREQTRDRNKPEDETKEQNGRFFVFPFSFFLSSLCHWRQLPVSDTGRRSEAGVSVGAFRAVRQPPASALVQPRQQQARMGRRRGGGRRVSGRATCWCSPPMPLPWLLARGGSGRIAPGTRSAG